MEINLVLKACTFCLLDWVESHSAGTESVGWAGRRGDENGEGGPTAKVRSGQAEDGPGSIGHWTPLDWSDWNPCHLE